MEDGLADIREKVDKLYAEKERQIGRRELYADIAKWTTWLVGAISLGFLVAKVLGHGG